MIRTLIVDDHELFCVGLSRVLADISIVDVVGRADSGELAVELSRELLPHVVLMDVVMPGIGGLEATRRIIRLEKDINIVMVTACRDEPYPSQSLKAGACGYVTKSSGVDELTTAIRRAYTGQRFVSADVAQKLALRSLDRRDVCPFEHLSSREMQITLMVINCHRVSEISNNLHLSPKTVNSYRYRIFEKLKVSSDVELALLAVKHGMIHPSLPLSPSSPIPEPAEEDLAVPSGPIRAPRVPSGAVPAGEVPSGEVPSGEVPSGEVPSGETTATLANLPG